jgi:hypothetical protein
MQPIARIEKESVLRNLILQERWIAGRLEAHGLHRLVWTHRVTQID